LVPGQKKKMAPSNRLRWGGWPGPVRRRRSVIAVRVEGGVLSGRRLVSGDFVIVNGVGR
jgi:hypothetical protein